MLEEILGVEGPLLHQPLVRRAYGGPPESPHEMSGRHAASLAEFVDGRFTADAWKDLGNFPWAVVDRRKGKERPKTPFPAMIGSGSGPHIPAIMSCVRPNVRS